MSNTNPSTLALPTVHLNGTGRPQLIEQNREAVTAIRRAIDALYAAAHDCKLSGCAYVVLLALAFFGSGCAPAPIGEYIILPHQEQAQAIAWEALHGVGPVPTIYWVRGAKLNCGGGRAFLFEGRCLGGNTYVGEDWSDVSTWPGAGFSDAPVVKIGAGSNGFAHEMAHHVVGGKDHPAWMFGPGGVLDAANAALRDAGL
ncbi:MAG: hypothetical protein ABIY37_04010 [Devosia sp.]